MQVPEEVSDPPIDYQEKNTPKAWMIAGLVIAVAAALSILLWVTLGSRAPKEKESEETETSNAKQVELQQQFAQIKLIEVSNHQPPVTFSVAGTVEPDQQQLQQITPLVSGRIENIYVALGDSVKRGTLLLRIDSPQIAEMHGKLHEAETRLLLAKKNLERVQESANRVSILKAKASLDEAESNLTRTKLLVSQGLSARKDLVATQSEFERATAEYNFQKDINLNREIAQAKAELQTAQTETQHIQDALKAFDAPLVRENSRSEHNISTIELRSPISGTVIERFVNQGAGFEQGKPLLTIASTAVLWVIANVPESQMSGIHVGGPAKVTLGERVLSGAISYIDPRLNEDTRTSRVRIEVTNPDNKIQVGSFAQIEFTLPVITQSFVSVPESSVQTVEGKTVVFVKESTSNKFLVREVQTGSASSGIVPVLHGLKVGEKVAADGSFVLKSKLLKSQFGEE